MKNIIKSSFLACVLFTGSSSYAWKEYVEFQDSPNFPESGILVTNYDCYLNTTNFFDKCSDFTTKIMRKDLPKKIKIKAWDGAVALNSECDIVNYIVFADANHVPLSWNDKKLAFITTTSWTTGIIGQNWHHYIYVGPRSYENNACSNSVANNGWLGCANIFATDKDDLFIFKVGQLNPVYAREHEAAGNANVHTVCGT